MQQYIKNYLEAHDLIPGEWMECSICRATAVDIHHVVYRSHGGSDDADNLIALCRKCHTRVHDGKITIG